jgi:F-type H+-transporting ATPase subunit epsilon
MAKLFKLEIHTQGGTLFNSDVSSLCVPAENGYLGVLANHAPLITLLTRGKVTFKDGRNNAGVIHSAGSGFMEVKDNKAVLLLEAVTVQS